MRPLLQIAVYAFVGLLSAACITGCATTSVQEGAVAGGLLGAGTGAIIGNQSGHQGEGALIGAAAGAISGALIGDQVDRYEARSRRSKRSRVPMSSTCVGPAPTPPTTVSWPVVGGHYENRLVQTSSGETYEERVWVSD